MNERHLRAFHDELTALVRAGVPLEQTLGAAGHELGRQAGGVLRQVGERLESGQPLEQVLADPALRFPPAYQAIVRVGLRSGRLTSALESLASHLRRRAETRRLASAAMTYPLIVLLVAYGVFLCLLIVLVPRLSDAFETFQIPAGMLAPLVWLRQTMAYWILPVPVISMLVGWWVWRRVWRSAFEGETRSSRWAGKLARTVRFDHAEHYCRMLAMLLEHDMPLPEALRLAGGASGNATLQRQSEMLASHTEQGRRIPTTAHREFSALPPMVYWTLQATSSMDQRIRSLRSLADFYQRRSTTLMHRYSTTIPIVVGAGLGGLAALLCCALIFAPIIYLYVQLGAPVP